MEGCASEAAGAPAAARGCEIARSGGNQGDVPVAAPTKPRDPPRGGCWSANGTARGHVAAVGPEAARGWVTRSGVPPAAPKPHVAPRVGCKTAKSRGT
jgi:hypothetical protein